MKYNPILFLIALPFVPTNTNAQTVWHVNESATGLNDGSSWENAFNFLQDGLATAISRDEIWVAEGIYRPDQGAGIQLGNRDTSFVIPSGLNMFGGFSGNESELNQRDWQLNTTVLSGDILQNDDSILEIDNPLRADNSRQIVRIFEVNEDVIIDGFTISGGHLEDVYFPHRGGSALQYNNGDFLGRLILENVRVESNVSWNGTISVDGSAVRPGYRALFKSVQFVRNWAARGGAIKAFWSRILIDASLFQGNAADKGSALDSGLSEVYVRYSSFIGNECRSTGAIHALGESPGFISVWSSSFTGNKSLDTGAGAITVDNSHLISVNNIFNGNISAHAGGAIDLGSLTAQIVNNVFAYNSAPAGGAIFSTGGQSTEIANSIFWNNSATFGADLEIFPSATVSVSNSIAQGSEINESVTEGEFWDLDPLFVDPDGPDNIPGTKDDDFRLSPGSPAIDAGDNSSLLADIIDLDGDEDFSESTPGDIIGNVRIVDGGTGAATVDVGVYEFDSTPVRTELESVAIDRHSKRDIIQVYPNPAAGHIHVWWLADTSALDLALYDLLGRRVKTLYRGFLRSNSVVDVDLSEYPAGIYVVYDSISGVSTPLILRE